jgi:gliding-associated putative ABC transporter substrate-binding component GldG
MNDINDKNAKNDKPSRRRQFITGANSVVVVVVAIAIAIVINAISTQMFLRFDMTESNRFTLSDASIEAVRDLDEPVEVKAFISPNLPEPFHNLQQSVSDTLDEYQARSDGKLTYQIIQPQDDRSDQETDEDGEGDEETSSIEETARGYGCEKVLVGERSENRASVRKVFKCMAFKKGDDVQVIPDIRIAGRGSFANLEYEITKELLNMQNAEPRVVGFVKGFGGLADQPQFIEQMQGAYEQLYGGLIEAQAVDLSGDTPEIGENVDALIIFSAESNVSDAAIFAIDQFVQRGGSVGWYQSATVLNREMMQKFARQMQGQRPPQLRKPVDTGLTPLFASFGIEHNKNLLLDYENGMTAQALTGSGLQQITLPATFQMNALDRRLPFLQGFSSIAMPTPSSVALTDAVEKTDAVTGYEAIQTRETATKVVDPPRQFNYQTFEKKLDGQKGQFTVAAALQGDIPSYYDDNPLPEGKTNDDLVADASAPARVLVVGSGDFLQPNPEVGYDGGLVQVAQRFFFASTEWLAQDTSLTQIRSKSMPTLLPKVNLETQRTVQFINIAMVPAIFAALGLLMYWRRGRRRERISKKFED